VTIAPNSNSCEKAFGFLSLQPSIQMNLKAERDPRYVNTSVFILYCICKVYCVEITKI
jgi:hypothetical protein